jgi:hypothetical protein
VLQYAVVPSDVALKDVARFLAAAPLGTAVRIVTRLGAVRDALRAWSSANGITVAYEDEVQFMAGDRLFAEYLLDIQRTPRG